MQQAPYNRKPTKDKPCNVISAHLFIQLLTSSLLRLRVPTFGRRGIEGVANQQLKPPQSPFEKGGGKSKAIDGWALIKLIRYQLTLIILSTAVCHAANRNYQLPSITSLPPVHFSAFKKPHPRLPAPTAEDIKKLTADNPWFFKQHRIKAAQGKLYSRILTAYVYPEKTDLDKLYQDLNKLKFSGRGDKQSKPLAIAYDWLYPQWTAQQRQQLRHKLQQACDYQIHIIRDKMQLSPYNVFLYNSPLQALVAVALALHTDIPENTDHCMRFTDDYWTHRVIPVWQQIMGNHGGWHEGGEYVGIGIGQAIYQIPAMWRHATGEDYFQSIPGIKGFLDFLVYRNRPDGTYIRHGDASFFDRRSPDRLPLAIEFRHQAAYNLHPVKFLKPTSWPWGPLTDPTLKSSQANSKLPLSKLFDGTGLLISRSSWDKNATYTSFKAGDNYWSHAHLDQGGFTIFKGGALAIDSGLYGSSYGSDHHLNYTYQSIAHNVVTITDPDETRIMAKAKAREIANDGGQRRVGSGWGRRAPLDRTDWNQQQNIYHTATLTQFNNSPDSVIAVADLTPAYNNKSSGSNTFAQRSKRVTSYQRAFIHDKKHDLILIFDRLISVKASFRKKWLLHSLHEPTIRDNFFYLSTPANTSLHMPGGKLTGQVLLPQKALLQKIGGKGFEYYVDGKNYDENGRVAAKIRHRKNTEAGQWRIELEPQVAHQEDLFLVALQPTLRHNHEAFPNIQLSRDKDKIHCKINGQTTYTFNLSNNTSQQLSVEF